ncbi:M23 family metallopeptidase [Romboutsia ilealis]|uniref:M23 family metallopeptidase n=1 Tax=Romboutsia faecis TaxID=2764597 RepID=A0ABR7JMZ2_9FIRM|nr:M23 family metallopeptidase [Romboutsia faecis]MBC5996273.1 M23 family metallopeptidase [Romboutsia faecis]MRN25085.1 M23 family metallopeptidase [Romboutsia ilealis]
MNKDLNKVILRFTISLVLLISLNLYNTSYSFGEVNKLDILIQNQEKQEELKEKINELDNILESKNQDLKVENGQYVSSDDSKSLEVVTISFVPQEYETSKIDEISSEIVALEENRNILDKELQDAIIEGVQLEKIIEEEVKAKLKSENIEFVTGIWPLNDYKDISSGYGYRIHPITNVKSFHKGIDIPAPQDTDVLAIDDGIVSFSGYQNGYGNVVKIKHFDGKTTVYAHNNSNVVKKGDIVKQGDVISKVGTTGNSTGNHVHFEIIINEKNINPIEGVIK